MKLTSITHIHTPELFIYKQIRDNILTKDNSFIADSAKVVNKILESTIEIKSILATQEYYDEFSSLLKNRNIEKFYLATKEVMGGIVGHKLHHNVMLHGIRPPHNRLEELGKHIIMVDEISSTENVGSIARSAVALGVNAYLLPKQGPHPFSRRALRVSMGHMAQLKTHLYDHIEHTLRDLKKDGYTIYGAEITADSIPLSKIEIADKWVIVMGHEGDGLSSRVLHLCDHIVHIEMMPNIKSFNVSVAASILMYQFRYKS